MAGNSALSAAVKAKKDEFYTQLTDIEKEMRYYRKHFKDKIVLCNCDDPFESNFFKYFVLNAINQHGMKVSRKELRHILNLKSNLGKQINRFIFEESGVLIGNALKSARNKEALFGGVLGIRHFCKDDAQYYYSGYLGKSINRSFPHACRIREVCSTGQTLQFQRYLPLLEVDFIRANGWTVIPFPFKYLREWRLQQG